MEDEAGQNQGEVKKDQNVDQDGVLAIVKEIERTKKNPKFYSFPESF